MMGCISEFYGIAVFVYYHDHGPPHFHAEYAGEEALFSIDTLELLRGRIARRARGLILEWASQYRATLQTDWELAMQGLVLNQIPPLE